MASYTQHYQLHQWASTDDFLRTDFNTDLEKIDTALGTIPRVLAGAYTGNGAETQVIDCGFTPVAVYTSKYNGDTGSAGLANNQGVGGLSVTGHPVEPARGVNAYAVLIVEQGFQVANRTPCRSNDNGETYHFLAIG